MKLLIRDMDNNIMYKGEVYTEADLNLLKKNFPMSEYQYDNTDIMTVKQEVVMFKVIKDIYWENYGTFHKVFHKDRTYKGVVSPSGIVVAESPYYPGVSDVVDMNCIEVIKEESNVQV